MKDPFIDALLAHAEADIPRQESYDRFGQSCIHYLKNVGLLGCRFDPWTCDEIIFITKSGKDYVRIYKNDLMLKDIVDYVMSGRPQKGPEFEAALRKAAGPLAQRWHAHTASGFHTRSESFRSSDCRWWNGSNSWMPYLLQDTCFPIPMSRWPSALSTILKTCATTA